MKYLKVNLWGQEIGRLVWDSATRRTYFTYNPELKNSIPDIVTLYTAIVGSTITEIENQLLFDEGIVAKGCSLTEQIMNVKAYYHN